MAEAKREDLGKLLVSLLPEMRVRRYRQMAAEAFERAAMATDPAVRAGHISLASSWQVLALELEHSHGLAGHPGEERWDRDDETLHQA